MGKYYIWEPYNYFFFRHMPLHIRDWMAESKFYLYEDVRGVMVNIEGNGHSDLSSNP